MTPAVSVILPVYNGAGTLAVAVQSILHGQFENFELLCIDDGSEDDSAAIIRRFAATDSRVRLIARLHEGIVGALNAGISVARGEYIARMDADDWSHPRRLALQTAFLREHPAVDVVSCLVSPLADECLSEGTQRYFAWVNASRAHEQIVRDLYVECPIPHPTAMLQRRTLAAVGGYRRFDGPEDYDLWLRLCENGARFAKIPQELLLWRVRPESLSRTSSRYRRRKFLLRKYDYVLGRLRAQAIGRNKALRILGAGKNGVLLARHCAKAGFAIERFIDIASRRIGSQRGGIAVYGPEEIVSGSGGYFYLCTVGSWYARDIIRTFLNQNSLKELEDYIIL